jgi:hypothetical protein
MDLTCVATLSCVMMYNTGCLSKVFRVMRLQQGTFVQTRSQAREESDGAALPREPGAHLRSFSTSRNAN